MQFSLTFRHMEATDALKNYATDRLSCVRKYFPDPIHCHVVMSAEKHHHRVDVNLQLHNGFKLAGTESTENMYSSIDMVAAKIERQVRKYKDRLRAHKVREMTPLEVEHSILAEKWHEVEKEHSDHAQPSAQKQPDGANPSHAASHITVETETMRALPLSIEDAVMQLNLVEQQFLVFRNEATGQINVIYRRGEGGYGLIDPRA